ncbi:unnamed protein product [Blepharisma stoltei]|uniref:Uncharacterized protein n=1 Tax=Blepharisma stoltei TaxID=1481888 RepID=A0AAU9IS68_9CILI|nr:unnamed protein product [Blepharisma stoltei]
MDQVENQIALQFIGDFSNRTSEKILNEIVNSVIDSSGLVSSVLNSLMPKIGEKFKSTVNECLNSEMNKFEQIKERNLIDINENQEKHELLLEQIGNDLLSISLAIGFDKLDGEGERKNIEKSAKKGAALTQDYEAVINRILKGKDKEVIKRKLNELNLEEVMGKNLTENTYYDLADELINLAKEGDQNSALWLEKICRVIPITQSKRKQDFFKKILFSNEEGFEKYQEILFQRL